MGMINTISDLFKQLRLMSQEEPESAYQAGFLAALGIAEQAMIGAADSIADGFVDAITAIRVDRQRLVIECLEGEALVEYAISADDVCEDTELGRLVREVMPVQQMRLGNDCVALLYSPETDQWMMTLCKADQMEGNLLELAGFTTPEEVLRKADA